MSFDAAAKGLTRLVECSVCYDDYNENDRLPKLLPCGHTLCLSCVQRISGEVSGSIVCSSCRAVTDVPCGGCATFPNDLTMIQAISVLGCSRNIQPPLRPPKQVDNTRPMTVDEQLDALRWKLTDLRCQCQLTTYSMKEFAEKCAYVRSQVKGCFDRLRQRIEQREAVLLQKIDDLDSDPVQSNSQLQVNNATAFIEYAERKISAVCQASQIKQLTKTCGDCLSRLHELYRQQMSNDRKMVFIETGFEDAMRCVDEVGSFDDSLVYEVMNADAIVDRIKVPSLPVRPSHLSTGGAAYIGPQLMLDSPDAMVTSLDSISNQYQSFAHSSDDQSHYESLWITGRDVELNDPDDDDDPRTGSLSVPQPTINQITIDCQSPHDMQVFNPNMFHSPTAAGECDASLAEHEIERISLSATQRCLGQKYFRHKRLFIGGPSGVAITEDRSIVVADKGNNCIRVFNEIGTHIRSFRCDRGKYPLKCPLGVTTNSQNKVIVVDGYYRVHVFDWNGEYVLGFISKNMIDSAQARTTFIGVAVDCDWNIYIVDPDDHCINVYNIEGVAVRRIGDAGRLGKPRGLCLHRDQLYVTDKLSNNIKIFSTADGSFIGKMGYGKGSGPGCLRGPRGIAADRKGNIIVADYGNNRVQMFDAKGNCVRIIESNMSALREPDDVAVFRDGRVVISDGGNERLLMV